MANRQNIPRKAQPNCIRCFLQVLHPACSKSGYASVKDLTDALMTQGNFKKSLAVQTMEDAVQDGILKTTSSTRFGPKGIHLDKYSLLRLSKLSEIPEYSHDPYCFECHFPGTLKTCRQCPRSFHELCYRQNVNRPNYPVPSGKYQKYRLATFSSDGESDSNALVDCAKDVRISSSLQDVGIVSMTSYRGDQFVEEAAITSVTVNETNNDPSSSNKTNLAGEKSHVDSTIFEANEKSDYGLCTCCRLLKRGQLHQSRNMQRDELCQILSYTFERNRSWVSRDLLEYLDSVKMPQPTAVVVLKLLCKIPKVHFVDITAKLKEKNYNCIAGFLVDILDLQHSIGVFFGTTSTEFEETKWFVRDICYDLSEIERCPDCFRHSHEANETFWFAKPCTPPHELVFAKYRRFPYWPAKVIRTLPSGKYDVRFFGDSHSRGLIDARFIKPIDTDPKTLKMGHKLGIKSAMKEMECHKMLLKYPSEIFSYHANKILSEKVMQEVVAKITCNSTLDEPRSEPIPLTEKITDVQRTKLRSVNSKQITRSAKNRTTTTKRITRSAKKNVKATVIKTNHRRPEEAPFISAIGKLKKRIQKLQNERKILKRKQWCYWCLKEAIYLCCFRAAYCSQDCQSRHWKEGHSKVCKNREQNKSPNA